jgi:hypothetical protein
VGVAYKSTFKIEAQEEQIGEAESMALMKNPMQPLLIPQIAVVEASIIAP